MKNISQIAFKIINNVLDIQEKQVVSVSGEIHNSQDKVFSLNEVAILEELAIAIRKKKAFFSLSDSAFESMPILLSKNCFHSSVEKFCRACSRVSRTSRLDSWISLKLATPNGRPLLS